MTHFTDLPEATPPELVVYRYGHLYVTQGESLSVLKPGHSFVTHDLGFTPDSYASYGGRLLLYGPDNLVELTGDSVTQHHDEPGSYSAPLGVPHRDGAPIGESQFAWNYQEINGIPYQDFGTTYVLPHLQRSFYAKPLAGSSEPHHAFLLFGERKEFSYYNGVSGDLLYADPPERLVPYIYPEQGILAAGCEDGYLFSPDMGISWRKRKLDGWGVLTERGLLQVSHLDGIRAVVGRW